MTMYSVDVYSGSSDSIIQDSHAQAVIVKATQGTGYVNPKCNHQVELAKSLGKKLGYYHYAGGGDPVAEADYFIDNIKGYIGTGMLIIDWEGYQNSAFGNTTWVRRFVDRVHDRTGVWCVIYVSESALAQVANCANDCGVWVAKYASMTWNSWTVPNMAVSSGAFKFITGWQYTGGDMDRSIWYLDEVAWDKCAKANVANPTPAPQPKVDQAKPVVNPQTTWTDNLGDTWHAEDGKFVSNTALHLRWGARPSASTIAVLPAGSVIKYDAWSRGNQFVYVRQPRGNGYGYVAVRNAHTGEAYGKFE